MWCALFQVVEALCKVAAAVPQEVAPFTTAQVKIWLPLLLEWGPVGYLWADDGQYWWRVTQCTTNMGFKFLRGRLNFFAGSTTLFEFVHLVKWFLLLSWKKCWVCRTSLESQLSACHIPVHMYEQWVLLDLGRCCLFTKIANEARIETASVIHPWFRSFNWAYFYLTWFHNSSLQVHIFLQQDHRRFVIASVYLSVLLDERTLAIWTCS